MRTTSTSLTRAATSQEKRLGELVRRDRVEPLVKLLKANPSILFTLTNEGRSWLHTAAEHGSMGAVTYLLQTMPMATFNRHDENGFPPVRDAVANGHVKVVQAFIEQGWTDVKAHVQHPGTVDDGRTLLHLAAMYRQPEMAALLLSHGSDMNARDKNGATALHLCCGITKKGKSNAQKDQDDDDHVSVAALLLAHGARTDLKLWHGPTPLDLALVAEKDKAVRPLSTLLEARVLQDTLANLANDAGLMAPSRNRPRL